MLEAAVIGRNLRQKQREPDQNSRASGGCPFEASIEHMQVIWVKCYA